MLSKKSNTWIWIWFCSLNQLFTYASIQHSASIAKPLQGCTAFFPLLNFVGLTATQIVYFCVVNLQCDYNREDWLIGLVNWNTNGRKLNDAFILSQKLSVCVCVCLCVQTYITIYLEIAHIPLNRAILKSSVLF